MARDFRILSVHVEDELQAELLESFLQKLNLDYEGLEGERWMCGECGEEIRDCTCPHRHGSSMVK